MRPAVLVLAGLDPTGGAGLLADVEALGEVGAAGWAVATALTAQGPRGAHAMEPVPVPFVLAEIEALLDGARELPRAAKTGMLGTAAHASALAERLRRRPLARVPLVVDPVLSASSGLALFDAMGVRAVEALRPLLERAVLVTPNWPELELLAGRGLGSEEEAVRAARTLPAAAVLVKGGHRAGPPVDLLVRGRSVVRLAGSRRPGTARGTGCRLASAVAGHLAHGLALEDAVRRAKRLVERYLDRARGGRPGRYRPSG